MLDKSHNTNVTSIAGALKSPVIAATLNSDTSNDTNKNNEDAKHPAKSGIVSRLNSYLRSRFCSEQQVIGIEIQPDKIKLCQARQEDSGKWKIIKADSANVLDTNLQESLKKNKSLYSKALKDLFEKNKIANKTVALAIPASIAIIKTVSLPLMPKENLTRATRIPSFWQNLVQISNNLADYSIYYRIVKESPATKEMDVLFIAAKHEDLNTYKEIVQEAGLELCIIDVGCFSINNIAKLRANIKSDLQVYMKVGRDENYLQILEHDKPYINDIFVSDNEKSYMNEYLENQIFQQRFISQLKHIIAKHEDKQKVKIEKIDVISNEANIDKFINAVNAKLEGVSIAQIDLLNDIEFPTELQNSPEFQSTKSSYAVAMGLATRNLDIFCDETEKNVSELVNLLPESENIIGGLKAKFYSKITLWSSVIICAFILLIFGLYSISRHHSVSAETVDFNQQNALYKEKQQVFNNINATSATLNKLIKIKEDLRPNQGQIINAFSEISSAIPEGVWLEEINIDKDSKIIITGRSFEEKGIIAFSKSFEQSENIENISITSLKSTTTENGTLVKEFIISGKFKGLASGS